MRTPKWLTGEAAEYFKRTAPQCIRMGTLAEADRDTFALLAVTYAKVIDAQSKGEDSIKFVALLKQFTNLAEAFGLSAKSRKRLGVSVEPETADEFGL
jgi:phage terminase small subunit